MNSSYFDDLYSPHFAAEHTGLGRGRDFSKVPQLAVAARDLNPDLTIVCWVFFPLIPQHGHIHKFPGSSQWPVKWSREIRYPVLQMRETRHRELCRPKGRNQPRLFTGASSLSLACGARSGDTCWRQRSELKTALGLQRRPFVSQAPSASLSPAAHPRCSRLVPSPAKGPSLSL